VITTQTQNAYVREPFSLDFATIAVGTRLTGIASFVWRDFAFSARPEAKDAAAGQYCSIRTAIPQAPIG
jgi:hypothetical protein